MQIMQEAFSIIDELEEAVSSAGAVLTELNCLTTNTLVKIAKRALRFWQLHGKIEK
jgi:hypothetical protein